MQKTYNDSQVHCCCACCAASSGLGGMGGGGGGGSWGAPLPCSSGQAVAGRPAVCGGLTGFCRASVRTHHRWPLPTPRNADECGDGRAGRLACGAHPGAARRAGAGQGGRLEAHAQPWAHLRCCPHGAQPAAPGGRSHPPPPGLASETPTRAPSCCRHGQDQDHPGPAVHHHALGPARRLCLSQARRRRRGAGQPHGRRRRGAALARQIPSAVGRAQAGGLAGGQPLPAGGARPAVRAGPLGWQRLASARLACKGCASAGPPTPVGPPPPPPPLPPRREEVVPPEQADSTDAFGLLRRSIPRRIGRNDGPKARVLVRRGRGCLAPAEVGPPCRPCPRCQQRARSRPHARPAPCYPQVCAPSNSALDEIVLRLITVGLTDQDGRVFTPNVVCARLDRRYVGRCRCTAQQRSQGAWLELGSHSALRRCIPLWVRHNWLAWLPATRITAACPPVVAPPCQVRVGVSIHHSVQSVALDTLVDHRLGGDASKVGVGSRELAGEVTAAGFIEGACLVAHDLHRTGSPALNAARGCPASSAVRCAGHASPRPLGCRAQPGILAACLGTSTPRCTAPAERGSLGEGPLAHADPGGGQHR